MSGVAAIRKTKAVVRGKNPLVKEVENLTFMICDYDYGR